jgi:hypothetical protein
MGRGLRVKAKPGRNDGYYEYQVFLSMAFIESALASVWKGVCGCILPSYLDLRDVAGAIDMKYVATTTDRI